MKIRPAIPVLLAALLGCATTPGEVPGDIAKTAPQISWPVEGSPFVYLKFALVSRTPTADGGQRLVVVGHDGDLQAGFAILLAPSWPSSSAGGDDLNLRKGSVVLESIGLPSSRFIQALDRLYSTGTASTQMRPATKFEAISLSGDPSALDRGPVKIKLFYDGQSSGRHAELYLDIDARAGRVELNEKDFVYRRPVVVALAAD
jgi:hypothetical protein